jgi:hypothetical protein
MANTYYDVSGAGVIVAAVKTYYTETAGGKFGWNSTTALSGYYGVIPSTDPGSTGALMKAFDTQGTQTGSPIPIINDRSAKDRELGERIKNEYCFYSVRYNYFLTRFLGLIAGGVTSNATTTEATRLLAILKDLNMKLNALADVVDYYATVRIAHVNIRTTALNTVNAHIQNNIHTTAAPAAALVADQNILNTRKEMIRYTKEKNNSIANQVSLWAALNIVAIGMIFHLYRTL